MAAEFNFWLLLVGVVGGALLTWLVLADSTRRDGELGEEELRAEAGWIARSLESPAVDADVAESVLRAHRRYLGFPPPDVLVDPAELPALEGEGVTAAPPAEAAPADAPGAAGPDTPDAADAAGSAAADAEAPRA